MTTSCSSIRPSWAEEHRESVIRAAAAVLSGDAPDRGVVEAEVAMESLLRRHRLGG